MKNLKNYIKSYINESAWDIEDNIEDDNKEFALEGIKKFIDDKYYNNISQYCEYIYDENRGKYIVNLKGTRGVSLKEEAEQLTNGSFEWGKVDCFFDCSNCDKLESLEGAPKEVGGDFSCSECPKLESLEGAPEKVDGAFVCNKCIGLKNLEGAPKTLKHYFDCNECPNLETLKGAPKKIGGVFTKKSDSYFNCGACSKLKNLEGAPEYVSGHFYCSFCTMLKSLKGAPKKVDGNFTCVHCPNLHSMDGIGKVGGKIANDENYRFIV